MLKYRIAFEPHLTTVTFTGHIDEHVGDVLAEVRSQVRTPRVVFHCAGIDLINSIGISTWIAHVKAFEDCELAYSHLPYTFVSLCRIIPVLASRRRILSFYARYYCERCDGDDFQLALVQRDESLAAGTFRIQACGRCRGPIEPDPNDLELMSLFKR